MTLNKKNGIINSAALFKIISKCNDSCEFCIEREFIERRRSTLSFEEIQRNFEYLEKNFSPDYAIITGGEPTLHPDFLKIMKYFSGRNMEFRVITNLIKFGKASFFKKVLPFLKGGAKIIGSINDLPVNVNAAARIRGLKNILKERLPLMLITVICKENLNSLPELVVYLSSLFKKYRYGKPMNLELRLIYIEGTKESLLKKSLPVDFRKVKACIQKTVNAATKTGAVLTLWNFPLCYLNNVEKARNEAIAERQARRLVKIHKDAQLKKAEIRNWEDYLKTYRLCQKCRLNDSCSGIDRDYIRKYNFPKPKPFLS